MENVKIEPCPGWLFTQIRLGKDAVADYELAHDPIEVAHSLS